MKLVVVLIRAGNVVGYKFLFHFQARAQLSELEKYGIHEDSFFFVKFRVTGTASCFTLGRPLNILFLSGWASVLALIWVLV